MENLGYGLFSELIDKYLPSGFQNIDAHSVLLRNLEKMTEIHDQFFYVGDVLKAKVLYCSRRSYDMLGVKPKDMDAAVLFTRSHPDNQHRHNLARTKLFNQAQDFFVRKGGKMVLSSNFKIRQANGNFQNTLLQCYFFYTTVPYETVFVIYVSTNVSWADDQMKGYHYYLGDDLSYFRIPDMPLLKTGCVLSEREFEILELISKGMNSEDIAKRIFLSVHTVNTHRRNIIAKTRTASTYDLILEFKNLGLL